MNLKDKVAIITGASSGIGAELVRELSEAGMKLLITARRSERLSELCRNHPNVNYLAGDIADPALPQALMDMALSAYGRCDVVFNNAGLLEVAPIEKIDIERLCWMVRVNVEAAYRMAYVAVRHFKKVGSGHLMNTSSVLGTKVRPTAGAYAGTKYAIEALSEGLRLELAGTGIRVTCIEPGLVVTELHNNWEVPAAQALNISKPLVPADITRAVRFILEQPDHVLIPRLMILPGEQQV